MTAGETALQAAVAALRSRHARVTPARSAVLGVLATTDRHLTADDIVALAAARAPGVHRATVYRALSTLGELDLVSHTHLGGSAAVYHLSFADEVPSAPTSHPHVHLRCTTCGAVLDVPITAMGPLTDELEHDLGFRLQPEHAALLGTCAHCLEQGTGQRPDC